MSEQAIKFPKEGNEWWPLPSDYLQLTRQGQRLSRVNACSVRDTPDDFVAAWNLFRRLYLFTSPPGTFYGDDLVESPLFHYQTIRDVAMYDRNLHAAPRGFAKSTLVDEVILMVALTQPRFPISLCLAADNMIGERFGIYQTQLETNELIIEDFGNQRPSQQGGGASTWNQHLLCLANGSRIRGFAAQGRKRGTKPRPRLLILDDPEHDPTKATDMQKLREDFDWLLFRQLLPMGEVGMKMWWSGTIITKQGVLYRAAASDDPRFQSWNRVVLSAEMPDENGDMKPLWPEYRDQADLDRLRLELGEEAFSAEYMNNPGEGTEATFQMDPEVHEYTVDGDYEISPLTSPAILKYNIREKTSDQLSEHRVEFGPFVSKLYRILTVDYASTVGRHSDYSAIVVSGFSRPEDILWVLDAWVGRVRDKALLRLVWKYGLKWRAQVVGVEAFAAQVLLADSAATMIGELSEGTGWMPRVMPLRRPSSISKQDQIGGMSWRFTSERIKLPGHLKNRGAMAVLYNQIRNFRAEARDGNLQFDDVIDTLSMYAMVARSRGSRGVPGNEARKVSNPLDSIVSGEHGYKGTNLNPLLAVNASDLTEEALTRIMNQTRDEEEQRNRPRRSLVLAHR